MRSSFFVGFVFVLLTVASVAARAETITVKTIESCEAPRKYGAWFDVGVVRNPDQSFEMIVVDRKRGSRGGSGSLLRVHRGVDRTVTENGAKVIFRHRGLNVILTLEVLNSKTATMTVTYPNAFLPGFPRGGNIYSSDQVTCTGPGTLSYVK